MYSICHCTIYSRLQHEASRWGRGTTGWMRFKWARWMPHWRLSAIGHASPSWRCPPEGPAPWIPATQIIHWLQVTIEIFLLSNQIPSNLDFCCQISNFSTRSSLHFDHFPFGCKKCFKKYKAETIALIIFCQEKKMNYISINKADKIEYTWRFLQRWNNFSMQMQLHFDHSPFYA